MTGPEMRNHIRNLAESRCKTKHRHVYDELICVGPGSVHFGPPCDECIWETEQELEMKRGKTQGREVSPEEATALRKKLGIS